MSISTAIESSSAGTRNPAPLPPHARSSEPLSPERGGRGFRLLPCTMSDIAGLVTDGGEGRTLEAVGVPHPFWNEFARMCAASHAGDTGALHWAVSRSGDGRLVGYAGLNQIDLARRQGELRVWVAGGAGRLRGATECSEKVVELAMQVIGLRRVYALQLERYAAAGLILESIGMQPEGFFRKRIQKEGMLEDVVCWSILRKNWPGP